MGNNFIRLNKTNGGEIFISANHIVAMEPSTEAWFDMTGTRTHIHLSLPLSGCDVKETVEGIISLVNKAHIDRGNKDE